MFVHFGMHAFNVHACYLLLYIFYIILYVIIDTQHQGIGFLKVRTEITVVKLIQIDINSLQRYFYNNIKQIRC